MLTSLLENYKANPSDLQDIACVCNFPGLSAQGLCLAGTGSYPQDAKSAIESIGRRPSVTKSEVFGGESAHASASDIEENTSVGLRDEMAGGLC